MLNAYVIERVPLDAEMCMKRFALLVCCGIAQCAPVAWSDDAAVLNLLRTGCTEDAQKLCAGVQPGGGRILACLKEHKDSLSDKCKQAAQQAASMSGRNRAGIPPPSPPPTGLDSAPANPVRSSPSDNSSRDGGSSQTASAAAKPPDRASASVKHSAVADVPGSYLRLKKAQIMVTTSAQNTQPIPGVEMFIPTTWNFKGEVQVGTSKSGCFCDSFPVVWEAKSVDSTMVFQGAPNYSWQYADDPQEMRKLNDPNRRQRQGNGKVCPVARPMSAEQFFRQNVMRQMPSGTTIVSIEPFTELNQMARQQMGLPPNDAGNGGVRTDAIRARVEWQKGDKPVEAWMTVAVVMRTYRAGRGSFFDSHAIDMTSLSAPKGKLDANDKLFKVMIASVRATPEWTAFANQNIASYYRLEAQKEAQIDQVYASLQNQITQTILQTTANAQRVSMQGAFAADQNIRGVQTFRDPSTGQTMELSNQYDHAWLNGANEYVMSDDPNFNPNSQLNGNWNQLQSVRP